MLFVADNPGEWPLESAIPEHRAAGAQFQLGQWRFKKLPGNDE
jgi:hypothetical protein